MAEVLLCDGDDEAAALLPAILDAPVDGPLDDPEAARLWQAAWTWRLMAKDGWWPTWWSDSDHMPDPGWAVADLPGAHDRPEVAA